MKTYYITFTVSGRLPFPLDMLRRDSCFPTREKDVTNIQRSMERGGRNTLQVQLCTIVGPTRLRWLKRQMTGGVFPNVERWETFAWHVIKVSPPRVIK